MNRVKNWLVLGAFSLLVLGIPATASAQWGGNNGGWNDPYGRNNGGYYGGSNASVRSLKQRTREFTRQLDRDLDRSRMNGSRREDRINEIADRFRDAVNNLDNDYYNNNRGYGRNDNEMRRVFDLAAQIDRSIGRADVSYNTRNLWYSIRNDLQAISRGYNDVYDNRNNRNRNGGWNNRNRQGLPSWWPF